VTGGRSIVRNPPLHS